MKLRIITIIILLCSTAYADLPTYFAFDDGQAQSSLSKFSEQIKPLSCLVLPNVESFKLVRVLVVECANSSTNSAMNVNRIAITLGYEPLKVILAPIDSGYLEVYILTNIVKLLTDSREEQTAVLAKLASTGFVSYDKIPSDSPYRAFVMKREGVTVSDNEIELLGKKTGAYAEREVTRMKVSARP